MTSSDSDRRTRAVGIRLQQAADEFGARPFVECGDDRLSYEEVDRLSTAFAGGLQRIGVAQGQRVALMLPNRVEFVVVVFALAKLGAVQVPLNTFLRGEFLRHQLADAGASIFITDRLGERQIAPLLGALPGLRQIVRVGERGEHADLPLETLSYAELLSSTRPELPIVDDTDLCMILYTSGTTGPSKGCLISHGYYTFIAESYVGYGWFRGDDTIFGANQLFHASGQISLVMSALVAGARVVIEPEFHASTHLARAQETGGTVLFGFGAMAMALMAQPARDDDRTHGIRQGTFVPLTAAEQDAFERRFGIPVRNGVYGFSECFPATLTDMRDELRPASIGRRRDEIEIRLVDDNDGEVPIGEVGEIVLRPRERHMMFDGYWNNPEATATAFRHLWLHTGDKGRLDADGYLYWFDRKKDSLRRRGENVSSMELERAIGMHPGIESVVVHAVPSDLSEQDIKACIIARPEVVLEPQELFDYFKGCLPYFAIPRYVELLEEFPMNSSHRVLKFELATRGVTEGTWDLESLGLTMGRSERRS